MDKIERLKGAIQDIRHNNVQSQREIEKCNAETQRYREPIVKVLGEDNLGILLTLSEEQLSQMSYTDMKAHIG